MVIWQYFKRWEHFFVFVSDYETIRAFFDQDWLPNGAVEV